MLVVLLLVILVMQQLHLHLQLLRQVTGDSGDPGADGSTLRPLRPTATSWAGKWLVGRRDAGFAAGDENKGSCFGLQQPLSLLRMPCALSAPA